MTRELEDLIRSAQGGDRDAFSRLVEEHYACMFRFACRYCGDRHDAEDVTQQACIKLARAIGQFRFESAFTSWLYRLVINTAKDLHKSQNAQVTQTRLTGDERNEQSAPDIAESAVLLRQVMSLVASMGEGFREVLVLVPGEGLTHAEAAAILEVKESTVSWRLHEIRKRLNAEVQPGVDV